MLRARVTSGKKKQNSTLQILPLKNSGPFKNKYTEKNDTRQCQYRDVIHHGLYMEGGLEGRLNWVKMTEERVLLMKGKDINVFSMQVR